MVVLYQLNQNDHSLLEETQYLPVSFNGLIHTNIITHKQKALHSKKYQLFFAVFKDRIISMNT